MWKAVIALGVIFYLAATLLMKIKMLLTASHQRCKIVEYTSYMAML